MLAASSYPPEPDTRRIRKVVQRGLNGILINFCCIIRFDICPQFIQSNSAA